MFDQWPKPTINKDFPVRSWLGVSCANPACPNYGKTDVPCPKAGKDKKTDRQRYKCKRCLKTFYRLDPPEGRLRIHRAPANEGVEAKPEENLKVKQPEPEQPLNNALESKVPAQPEEGLETKQPEPEQPKRKKVSFLLTYQAVQGLHKVCASFGLETSELLEQIGQGTLEVQFARKELKLSAAAIHKSVT